MVLDADSIFGESSRASGVAELANGYQCDLEFFEEMGCFGCCWKVVDGEDSGVGGVNKVVIRHCHSNGIGCGLYVF